MRAGGNDVVIDVYWRAYGPSPEEVEAEAKRQAELKAKTGFDQTPADRLVDEFVGKIMPMVGVGAAGFAVGGPWGTLAACLAACGGEASSGGSLPPSRNPPSPIPLYQDVPICEEEIIPVTLTTQFEVDAEGMIVSPNRDDREWQEQPITVTFCDGEEAETHSVDVRFRGHNRRLLCKIPPVEIRFRGDMPWFLEGADRDLKLVTECNITGADGTGETIDRQETDEERDQMAFTEHLMYRTMETLGVPTLRTRLGQFSLVGREGQIFQGLGFFRESEDDLARRMGAVRREVTEGTLKERSNEYDLIGMRLRSDDVVAARLANKLISNDDYLQNHILLEYPDESFGLAIYDFDKSDLVWCASSALRQKFSSPRECGITGSYDAIYQEAREWLQERMLGYDGHDGENAFYFERIGPLEMQTAFLRVAERFLSHRDDAMKVADHPLLVSESREIMRVQFTAFFDALEDTLEFARRDTR